MNVTRAGSAMQNRSPFPLSGASDDIINFAFNAERYGVQLWILNQEEYGRMTRPLDAGEGLDVSVVD